LAKKQEILVPSPWPRNRKSFFFSFDKEQEILFLHLGQEAGNPDSFTLAKEQKITE